MGSVLGVRLAARPNSVSLPAPFGPSRSFFARKQGTRKTVRVQPETHYARSGDVSIAYHVVGTGPFDLVWVQGFVSNVELAWQQPILATFNRQLASFCRLIRFDKRGTGSVPLQVHHRTYERRGAELDSTSSRSAQLATAFSTSGSSWQADPARGGDRATGIGHHTPPARAQS